MTTLAIATTEHLLLSATASLKRTSSLLSSGPKTSIPRPLAGTWSSDNSTLFLVFSDGIRKYNDRGAVEDVIFPPPEEEELQACIVAKDNSTIIGALSSRIVVLESNPCSSDYTIVKTIDTHTSPVISLAISNDGAVLASTSQTTVYVHTLGIDSHTALRGLPQSSEEPPLCSFSPHFRTKLIVGSGQVLYVYDITRPSSPTKTIPLGSGANGDVVSLACSPYSKTLVAAACEGGTVHLIDLEKEKGFYKMVDVKTRITSLVFSPEGAAMYIGTDGGNLLVVDLRSLDKSPKSISASGIGSRVECLVVQAKSLTPASESSSKQPLRKPLAHQDQNWKTTPQRRPSSRPASTKSPISALPAKSKESTVPTPVRKRTVSGVVRSPSVKSPPVIRRSASTLSNTPSKTVPPKSKVFSPPPRKPPSTATIVKGPKGPANNESEPPKEVKKATKPLTKATSKSPLLPKTRPTAEPARRVLSTGVTETKAAPRRPLSTLPSISTTMSRKPKSPSVTSPPSLGKRSDRLSVSGASSSKPLTSTASSSRKSTTPSTSPELHIPDLPIMPLKGKKSGSMFNLQSSDDEDEDWDAEITTKQPTRPKAGFGVVSHTEGGKIKELDDRDDKDEGAISTPPKKTETALQVTPARPGVQRHPGPWAPVPSPLRRGLEDMQHTGGAPSSIGNVHNMLHQVMRDVMYDYQEDMRTELVGMHLDMVRMGRNWKKDMKDVMDTYAKDLRELREENRLLREENERLKRGY